MGSVIEFTGGRRCAECGGGIDPGRVRIFAGVVVCEPCRNNSRRRNALPVAGRGALYLVPAAGPPKPDGYDEFTGE